MLKKLSPASLLVIKIMLGSIIMSAAFFFITNPEFDPQSQKFVLTEQFTKTDERDFYQQLALRKQQITEKTEQKHLLIGPYKLSKIDLILTNYIGNDQALCENYFAKSVWSNKYNISSKAILIETPLVQDNIIKQLSNIYYADIDYFRLKNAGVNTASLIAVMHLYNIRDVAAYFHGSFRNTEIQKDLRRFAKYEIGDLSGENFGIIDALWQWRMVEECGIRFLGQARE